MASKAAASLALFLALNLFLFTFASAGGSCGPKSKPTPKPAPKPTPKPSPKPTPTPSGGGAKCPIDTLKLGACGNVLNGLVNVVLGKPPKEPCCSLISGLADAEAAVCLCTAIKANILGINLNVPVDLTLLVNYCGKKVPSGFQCY